MGLHGALSVVACAGHLAFAIAVWLRRKKSPIAPLLALLFLDTFGWNFAALARELGGGHEWRVVDRVLATFMPALALHVVVAFVGRARALRLLVRGLYVASAGLALLGADVRSEAWWMGLLAVGGAVTVLAVWLLAAHRAESGDSLEQKRAELILVAFVVGALMSSTELWFDEVSFGVSIPRLGSLGTLIAMALFAVATLRLRLIEASFPPALLVYAVALAVLAVAAYLAAVRWLDRTAAFGLLAILTAGVIGLAAAREVGGARAVERERMQRLLTLGRFSEQLAHDLRNPLAALKGSLQFLAGERDAGRSLDAQVEYLSLMLDQVGRMERTVSDYQRLAKVEPVLLGQSLNDLVREVVDAQRLAIPANVDLHAELDPGLPRCRLDRDLIATALENLIRNASEAMPAGGRVTVRTARTAGDPGRAVVSVEDAGEGIDPRAVERAMDEFFTTKATGSGLGLSFAKRVAEAHGGVLRLTSQKGRGTLVSVTLPCVE